VASRAVKTATSGPSAPPQDRRRSVARPTLDPAELAPLVGAKRAKTLTNRLEDAAVAFGNQRYVDARRLLRALVSEAPDSHMVRELLGLTQYHLGNWPDAIRQLEALRVLSQNDVTQHPVLADCYRAQKKYAIVDELWAELKEASPSAELVSEGRIVYAGSLVDRGKLGEAIRELERGWKIPKRPRDHHLARAYALANAYEMAGEILQARALFGWIVACAPEFSDSVDRLASLG
jgi:predicted Zn-dependent protease